MDKKAEAKKEGSGDLSKKEPKELVFRCVICGRGWFDDPRFASDGEGIVVKGICEECSREGYSLTATETGEVIGEKVKEEPIKMRIRAWNKQENRFVGRNFDSMAECEQAIQDYGMGHRLEARQYEGARE